MAWPLNDRTKNLRENSGENNIATVESHLQKMERRLCEHRFHKLRSAASITNEGDWHPNQTTQTTRPLHPNQQNWNTVEERKKETRNDTNVPGEYVLRPKVRHVHTPESRTYVILCCKYSPVDNKFEQLHHITENFTKQYWNLLNTIHHWTRRNWAGERISDCWKVFRLKRK